MVDRPELDARQARAAASPGRRPATVAVLITELARTLGAAGVPLPHEEARDLVSAILDVPRYWPALHGSESPSAELVAQTRRAAARRAVGAPMAYAVGRATFREFTLDVDERVLIPRPETELLPDLVLGMIAAAGGTAVDVGTGSGAIALALAADGRFAQVIATDISADALAVARGNVAMLHGALRTPIECRLGAGLAPVAGERLRAVVSNPPYIAFGEVAALPASVRDWEPPLALACAGDGLALTRALVRDAAGLLEPGGVLALEVDIRRAMLVAELVASHGAYAGVRIELDLTGRERFVVARREAH